MEEHGKAGGSLVAQARISHPWPAQRFRVKHPRLEKPWDHRRGEMTPSPSKTLDGERLVSATAERLEQIPHRLGSGWDTHRGYQNESSELVACQDRSENRAPAAEGAAAIGYPRSLYNLETLTQKFPHAKLASTMSLVVSTVLQNNNKRQRKRSDGRWFAPCR